MNRRSKIWMLTDIFRDIVDMLLQLFFIILLTCIVVMFGIALLASIFP